MRNWSRGLVPMSLSIASGCSSSEAATALASDDGSAARTGSTGGVLFVATGGAPIGADGAIGGTAASSGGSAGSMPAQCPDLHTPPADCPTKVYVGTALVATQAAADALAGYTEIQGALNIYDDLAGPCP